MSVPTEKPVETPKVWIRFIVELLGHCAGYDQGFESMIAEGAILNEYIVAGRYPGDVFSEPIDPEAAEEALRAVETIRSRVIDLVVGK